MKKEVVAVLVILVLSVSIISSISLVSAGWLADTWNKITGKVVEENVTPGSEPEECRTISGWRIENNKCIEDSGCDYDDSKYTYYGKEECESQLESPPEPPEPQKEICCKITPLLKCISCPAVESKYEYRLEKECVSVPGAEVSYQIVDNNNCEEPPEPPPEPPDRQCSAGDEKYYTCGDGTKVLQCKCENNMWVCKISPENDCSEEEPTRCAAKIKINFDKNSYVVGEQFELKIGVFDSQENPLSNYAFYAEMYDDRWHTPDLQRTGADGYLRHTGTAEKLPSGITKVKFKVYTKGIGSCGIVEDTIGVEIRQAPVPCGIGGCVPEPECKDKIKMCGGDCPPCAGERNKTDIFYPCSGCEVDDRCYPVGYRKEAQYCSIDYEFVSQIEEGKCDNNFECKSNLCVSGECIGEGLIKRIIAWFKKLFGGGGEEDGEVEKDCSKLLIEKDIGDNEYEKSGYGENEHTRVPVYSEDGENTGTIKCCMAEYSTGATIVCPFDNKEDTKNSLKWIIASGEVKSFSLEEYKGEKIINADNNGMIIWTNEEYIIASGGKPEAGNKFVEDIADAYLEKYPSDFDLTEDDIPYIEPKPWVSCTEEDEIAVKKCVSIPGSRLLTDPHPDKDCEVYKGCILSGEDCEEISDIGERENCYVGVADRTKDSSVCEKITDAHQKEKCYIKAQELPEGDSAKEFLIKAEILGKVILIDFETLPDGTILQSGDRLSGKEWESLGVVFEFPSEDYLQVFGPKYPFNPLDKLSLSPGLGPFEAGGETHDDLNIIFSEPVKAVGLYLLDLGETDERESISFLDASGNVIKKISPWPKSTFGNPAPGTFVGLVHDDGISKIKILENTQDSDDIAYDNLYFVK